MRYVFSRLLRKVALLALLLQGLPVLAGSQTGGLSRLPQRPEDSPDIVIMGFAGFFTAAGPLGTSGIRFTNGNQLLVDAFHAMGQTVQWRDYAPSMGRQHISPFLWTEEPGFEQAVRDMEWIKTHWQDGFANPTRIVLIGVSGGGALLNLFPFLFPDVQFDYLIGVDTGCVAFSAMYLSWLATTPPWKSQYLRRRLRQVPRRYLPWILGVPAPCAEGPRHRPNIGNLIPYNVIYNLDTRTALISSTRLPIGIPFLPIQVPLIASVPVGIAFNIRPFSLEPKPRRGPQAGIYRFVDTTAFHAGFDIINDGTRWVTGMIMELGLPPWSPPKLNKHKQIDGSPGDELSDFEKYLAQSRREQLERLGKGGDQ